MAPQMAGLGWCIVTQIAFVWRFHSTPRLNAFSNRLAVNKHSRSCSICLVFKCTLKLLAWTDAKSRTHCIFLHFSTMCAFSNRLPEKMLSPISCICLIFLNCVFSNAASNCLYYMKYNYTRYMITCWNGFSPECGVVVFYVISQNFITYLPHQIQLR